VKFTLQCSSECNDQKSISEGSKVTVSSITEIIEKRSQFHIIKHLESFSRGSCLRVDSWSRAKRTIEIMLK